MWVAPVTLTGQIVRLEPLRRDHASDLALVGRDEAIWRLMPYGSVTTEERMRDWIDHRNAIPANVAFAVIHQSTARAIGSTSYLEIRPEHRTIEIGATWYGLAYQRTGVNTECKFLLLRHAFEVLGCIRVQLKTDARNERSQRAIERIGAVREGVLRNHMILPDGHRRATVMYSITDDEWPGVRQRLQDLMARSDSKGTPDANPSA